MARLKKGLDFFYFDISFYDDIKIRKLIRYQGAQAVVIYQLILIRIYSEGYYLVWDDDLPFVVAEISHLQDDYVKTVIDYCIEIGLFDKQLFESDHILTSKGIQNRFFDFCVVSKRKIILDSPFLLVDLSTKALRISKVRNDSGLNQIKNDIIPDNSELSPENTEENDKIRNDSEKDAENSEFGTQSKVKESKDNNSLRSSLSPSPPSPAHARGNFSPEGVDEGISAKDGVRLLMEDRDWMLQIQRKFRKEPAVITQWLDSFVVDCDCRGKQQHQDLSDVKQHFNDWMTKMMNGKGSGGGKRDKHSQTVTIKERWIQCKAELQKAVSADVSAKSFDLMELFSFDESKKSLIIQIPSKDVYEFVEDNLVKVMSSYLLKYFGKIQLSYHVINKT